MTDPTNEPDLADPTNARLRDFDIPVVLPRYDLVEPPSFAGRVTTADLPPVKPFRSPPSGAEA